MSDDMQAGARFIANILAKATEKPAAKPSAPVKLPITPEELQAQRDKRAQEIFERDQRAVAAFRDYPQYFDQVSDEVGYSNVEKVKAVVKERFQNLWDGWTVKQAIVALASKGELKACESEPEPQPTPAPVKAAPPAPRPVATVAPTQPVAVAAAVDDLPDLPSWVWRQLGSNKLLTRRDVRSIPPGLYSELYRSNKYGEKFRARVNYILSH